MKKYKFLQPIEDTDAGTILFLQDGMYYYKNNTEYDRWKTIEEVENNPTIFEKVN